MREAFSGADHEALTRRWNEFFPEKYRITSPLLEQNTTTHPLFDWGASCLDVEPGGAIHGFLAIKRSPNPSLFPGPNMDTAHITTIAYQKPDSAVDMLASAKMILRNRGIAKLTFGGDCGHFFPGCPADCPKLRDLLTVEGFEKLSDAYDVERDLQGYSCPDWAKEPLSRGEVVIRRSTELERPDLRKFLAAEFPGRWHYDVVEKCEVDGEDNDIVLLLVDGKVEGFAMTQTAASSRPRAGAVWAEDLGESWCALGPIGISKAVRGQKLGHALLGASLEILREAGGRRCIIDWTTLLDFYGAHGFEISRTYTKYTLDLAGPIRA